MTELLFKKEYELLQPITFAENGNNKQTKTVVLHAPTFKQSEKIESALRQIDPITAIINFICDAGLMTNKEGVKIPSGFLSDLHIQAYRALANDYCKFFLTSELSEEEKKLIS